MPLLSRNAVEEIEMSVECQFYCSRQATIVWFGQLKHNIIGWEVKGFHRICQIFVTQISTFNGHPLCSQSVMPKVKSTASEKLQCYVTEFGANPFTSDGVILCCKLF